MQLEVYLARYVDNDNTTQLKLMQLKLKTNSKPKQQIIVFYNAPFTFFIQ